MIHVTTLEPWGFPMEVEYEYESAEAAILSGDDAHPGHPAEVTVLTCKVGGVDISAMLFAPQRAALEFLILREQDE